jgi:hypothetical protein|tara:strand:+ start:559 stop:750 length:192 start_codon:yes stop_codon:yes gene_type:complete
MYLKLKDTLEDRRSEQDRRTIDKKSWANIEKRKRPDRRIEGLDVDVFTVSEEEFLDMFAAYLT